MPNEPQEQNQNDIVSIPRSEWEAMKADMDAMKGITSETRRQEWQKRKSNDPNIKLVYLKKFKGNLVTAWSNMTVNKNKKLANGDYEEELRTTLLFSNGTQEEVEYMDFCRSNDLEYFKIVSAKNGKDPMQDRQTPLFTLERPDGTTFEAPVYAVNP